MQMLKLVSQGLTIKEVASQMDITSNQATARLWSLKLFFGAKNNAELIAKAVAANELILNVV